MLKRRRDIIEIFKDPGFRRDASASPRSDRKFREFRELVVRRSEGLVAKARKVFQKISGERAGSGHICMIMRLYITGKQACFPVSWQRFICRDKLRARKERQEEKEKGRENTREEASLKKKIPFHKGGSIRGVLQRWSFATGYANKFARSSRAKYERKCTFPLTLFAR